MAAAASLDELPEGAGGEEADLHTLVPDSISRQAERPGLLRNALEARAAVSNDSVNCVFSRLVAQCFIRYFAAHLHECSVPEVQLVPCMLLSILDQA